MRQMPDGGRSPPPKHGLRVSQGATHWVCQRVFFRFLRWTGSAPERVANTQLPGAPSSVDRSRQRRALNANLRGITGPLDLRLVGEGAAQIVAPIVPCSRTYCGMRLPSRRLVAEMASPTESYLNCWSALSQPRHQAAVLSRCSFFSHGLDCGGRMRSYGLVCRSTPVDLASKPSCSHCQGVSIYSPISTAFAARSRPNITTSPGNLARRRDQPNAHAQTQVIAASEQTSWYRLMPMLLEKGSSRWALGSTWVLAGRRRLLSGGCCRMM